MVLHWWLTQVCLSCVCTHPNQNPKELHAPSGSHFPTASTPERWTACVGFWTVSNARNGASSTWGNFCFFAADWWDLLVADLQTEGTASLVSNEQIKWSKSSASRKMSMIKVIKCFQIFNILHSSHVLTSWFWRCLTTKFSFVRTRKPNELHCFFWGLEKQRGCQMTKTQIEIS